MTIDPPEIIEVEDTVVACNGGGGALGHPRVYLIWKRTAPSTAPTATAASF